MKNTARHLVVLLVAILSVCIELHASQHSTLHENNLLAWTGYWSDIQDAREPDVWYSNEDPSGESEEMVGYLLEEPKMDFSIWMTYKQSRRRLFFGLLLGFYALLTLISFLKRGRRFADRLILNAKFSLIISIVVYGILYAYANGIGQTFATVVNGIFRIILAVIVIGFIWFAINDKPSPEAKARERAQKEKYRQRRICANCRHYGNLECTRDGDSVDDTSSCGNFVNKW